MQQAAVIHRLFALYADDVFVARNKIDSCGCGTLNEDCHSLLPDTGTSGAPKTPLLRLQKAKKRFNEHRAVSSSRIRRGGS
jgi:hypothetical protein